MVVDEEIDATAVSGPVCTSRHSSRKIRADGRQYHARAGPLWLRAGASPVVGRGRTALLQVEAGQRSGGQGSGTLRRQSGWLRPTEALGGGSQARSTGVRRHDSRQET